MMSLPQTLTLSDQPKLDTEFTKGRFNNQVVIVTGGCGGIGSSFVFRFVNDGAKVAIIDFNEARAQEMINVLGSDKVKYYKVDVSNREACFKVVQQIANELGKVNHLVNAVAYFGSKGLDATKDDWDKTMSVNVAGFSHMAQACYAEMKKISLTENCSILNISSISAHQTQPDRWTYSASKGAINILTKTMALDMSEAKIRVNSVSPAWIWSPEVAKIDPQRRRDKCEDIASKFHMLRRMGEMAEVAAAGTFLCSRDAKFITATDLKVDGGYGAMGPEGFGETSVFAGVDA